MPVPQQLTFALGLPLVGALSGPTPVIDIYTMGAGRHLFERFGHAAICVMRPERHRSRCYNYGTTDFGSPPEQLGWAFLRGQARFWVSVSSVEAMLETYAAADRSLWRQRLELSTDAVERIVMRLEHDAQRENREYIYHHFDDNCSTRVRDILEEATDGGLSAARSEATGQSYRQLAKRALAGEAWAAFTSDLLVGRRADARPDGFQAMFLPDALRGQLERRMNARPVLVHRRRAPEVGRRAADATHWFLFSAVATTLPMAAARRLQWPRVWLALSATLLALLGCVIWSVSAFTQVPELRENEMLLVFWPFDLLLALLTERARRWYARLRLVELAAGSARAAIGVLHQPLLLAVLIVVLPCLLVALPKRALASSL
jgi:hypothetical protein